MQSNTEIRNNLNGGENQTAWQKTWQNLLSERMSACSTVHRLMKHSGIHTCTWNLNAGKNLDYNSTGVYRTYSSEFNKLKTDTGS